MSKGLEKYLQDAEQCHALEVDYFDDNATCWSEEPNLEEAEHTIQSSKDNQIPPTQTFIADIIVARKAPESKVRYRPYFKTSTCRCRQKAQTNYDIGRY